MLPTLPKKKAQGASDLGAHWGSKNLDSFFKTYSPFSASPPQKKMQERMLGFEYIISGLLSYLPVQNSSWNNTWVGMESTNSGQMDPENKELVLIAKLDSDMRLAQPQHKTHWPSKGGI